MLEAKQVINERYQIQENLGRNAGRQTWLANDLSTEKRQKVVLKLLSFGGDVQWEDLKLFEREAQTLQQLDHSRIPKYQDYFSIDDRTLWFGLVQEYIPGSSLKQLLVKGKRFSEAEVKKIAEEILQILIYLHSFNPPLLHRDIKPSNLILGEDKNIYLVDFGAVQDCAATEGATFTVVGTYGYAPMEQFGGKAVPASDLYALGATLIHLLTRTTPGELPTKDLHLQFQDKVTIDSNFSKWLDKIIYPAVEKRFKTAQEALDYLQGKKGFFDYNNPSPEFQTRNISNHQILVKPLNSRVEIERHPNIIEITIAPKNQLVSGLANSLRENLGSPMMLVGGIFVLFVLLSLNPIALPIIIIVYLLNIKSKCLESKISLRYHQFQIMTNFLGFKTKQQGLTRNIQDVSINYVTNSQSENKLKPNAIVINTKLKFKIKPYERFVFGQGLSEEELLWLVSEIRGWLASIDDQQVVQTDER